jgi:ATP dependent DNA ligase domain
VPPSGPDWLHEIKFDGYRVLLHKVGKDVVIYSRRGADFTKAHAFSANAMASREFAPQEGPASLDGSALSEPGLCRRIGRAKKGQPGHVRKDVAQVGLGFRKLRNARRKNAAAVELDPGAIADA